MLHQDTDEAGAQHGAGQAQGQPDIGQAGKGVDQVGPDHEKRGVSKIDYASHPENQAEA